MLPVETVVFQNLTLPNCKDEQYSFPVPLGKYGLDKQCSVQATERSVVIPSSYASRTLLSLLFFFLLYFYVFMRFST